MQKIRMFFVAFVAVIGVFMINAGYGQTEYIDRIPFGGYIAENQYLNADITITDDSDIRTIVNMGTIASTIHVVMGRSLTIQNAGTFSGAIELEKGAELTQMITTDADITRINVADNAAYDILVRSDDKLSLDSIVALGNGSNVNQIKLDGGVFSVDNIDNIRGVNLRFYNHVELFLNDVSGVQDGVVLAGMHWDDASVTVHLDVDSHDPMFSLSAYVSDDKLMLERIRNTNYSYILDNALGEFLDDLRESGLDTKLLDMLDSAQSMAELNAIMARSARINLINLMRPIRIVDMYMQNSAVFDAPESGISVSPMYIGADGMDIFGVRGNIFARFSDRFTMALDGYVARGSYENDLDDFDMDVYGGNFAAEYDASIAFVRGLFGVTHAAFDIGPVFNGTGMAWDPDGYSLYGFADVGHKFTIMRDIYVAPFVGVGSRDERILDGHYTDTFARFGTDAGITADNGDLRYDYTLRLHTTDAGDMACDVRMSVWSVFDAAGMHIAAGIINHDDITAYTVSAGLRFQF